MQTLAAEDICKSYRGRRVVNGVSLRVGQGEVVGLLGPNGAGKTTTFYTIVGLIPPDAGRVLINEDEITDVPMYKRARQFGISYLPQEASVFRKLTVEENILAVLEAQPVSWHERRETMEQLIDQLGLEHIRRTGAMRFQAGNAEGSRSQGRYASIRSSFFWMSRFPGLIPSRYSICKRLSAT